MEPGSSRALFVYLNVDSLPRSKGKYIESVVASDDEEAREIALRARGFKYVIILRLANSIDGTYVRLPVNQEMNFIDSMLNYIEKSGFEVGAYSFSEDRCCYRAVMTDAFGPKKPNVKVYEVVASSRDSLNLCFNFLQKLFGEKR